MNKELLYLQIAKDIEHQIRTGLLKTGDKLPSIRTIRQERGVSMSTATQAYIELESRGLIESKPQSGFFVTYTKRALQAPATTEPVSVHGMEEIEDIIETVYNNRKKCDTILSMGTPSIELLPVAKLNKSVVSALRSLPDSGIGYDLRGNQKLKELIAQRAMMWGGQIDASEIITTAGCMDAIAFSLLSLTKAGDTIIVESPVYYGILQLAKNIGLKVLELPTNSITGIEPDALKKVLKSKKISLCILVSNYNNPYGSCMPDENKKTVVKLLEQYGVPLVEDDEYGEFHFGNKRPSNCKTFDESGNVIWCGSFSKTLAPGYRVGWVSAGKFHERISRTKSYHSLACNSLAQEAIANFIENSRYDHHLRNLRRTLYNHSLQFLRCISEYFPEDVKVSSPEGGFILWVEMGKKRNALELYDKAVKKKISIAPGRMYTLQNQYNDCFKLSFGMPWSPKIEQSLKTLGKLIHEL